MSDVSVEWISDQSALASIEGAWRDLEGAVERRTHVSTFDFIATWYRYYAGEYGGTPLIGLAWRGSELAGLAPLTVRRGRLGRIPVTRIDFAPNDSIAGELLVRDERPDVVAALLGSLVSTVRFDVICLNGFEPGASQLAALQGSADRRRLATELEDHAFARVDLSAGYDRYWATRSGNMRRKVSQRARRIEALGETVDGVLPADTGDIDTRINRLIAITEASYKLQGQRLADHHRGFLAELCRRFAAREMLSLPVLSIGGHDTAFIAGVVERGCFYDVTLSYDESYAELGPGVHLMQKTLKRLAEGGIHTVVSHGAHEYKRHWASAFVPQKRLFLFAPRPLAAATRFVRFGLRPLWQRIRAGAHPATPAVD
jgi:CelD/BcsL family acetyltransferase involved in cellulose biosynthesis